MSTSAKTSRTAGASLSAKLTYPNVPLPEGPYSALTAPGNLCTAKNLTMPTEFLAQNGAELKQTTKITVTGCPKHKQKARKHTKRKPKHGKRGKRKKR